jgi:oligopeptide/dipeptide ABC transporter ATP-binding protein
MQDGEDLLCVEHLSISFPIASSGGDGTERIVVVDDASFAVGNEETVGLVGESGSGKTISALAVMGLNRKPARVDSGLVWFRGVDLRSLTDQAMGRVRGRSISMIPQTPRSSLNPLMRVGDQIARVFTIQQGLPRRQAYDQAREMLRLVGIPEVDRHMRSYPHQLSGGMSQRILIAMMIACEPDLLIADEPTTGLDVTVQAQIFELIKQVQQARRMSVLLITHDLGVIAELCRRMVVMYAGHVMEAGGVECVFEQPCHPYTQMLLQSMLRVDKTVEAAPLGRTGVEEILYTLTACRFAARCPSAMDMCRAEKPPTVWLEPGHKVMCHLYQGQMVDGSMQPARAKS